MFRRERFGSADGLVRIGEATPGALSVEGSDEHEHDLVSDRGVSSIERYAALCVTKEDSADLSSDPPGIPELILKAAASVRVALLSFLRLHLDSPVFEGPPVCCLDARVAFGLVSLVQL